jgi:hypothetical protein
MCSPCTMSGLWSQFENSGKPSDLQISTPFSRSISGLSLKFVKILGGIIAWGSGCRQDLSV